MASLSQYLSGVAIKRLVSGELPYDMEKRRKSTQHEFNATKQMIQLFGAERIESKPTTYIYLSDSEEDSITEVGLFSFYNSREGKPRSPEYRIYYNSKNSVVGNANEGDLLVVAKTIDSKELFIIVEKNSTVEQQLLWLFSLHIEEVDFQIKDLSKEKSNLEFVQKYILDAIGVEIEEFNGDFLSEMLIRFNGVFPSMVVFSEYARSKQKEVDPIDDPDYAVLKWYEKEYELFKILENYLIKHRLNTGFGKDGKDVDEFLKYSLSIHQRRKARSGVAFENHLKEIFIRQKLKFTPQPKIGRAKPDFIFPGINFYNDKNFPIELLTMLGAKTTSKERWKQLIPESKIIPKHFITLEPAISKNQTNDMIEKGIQLIVPKGILISYKPEQQNMILSFKSFIDLLKDKQTRVNIR